MKICIIGLGYVGAVSVGAFAELGHTIIGVDTDKTKVDAINNHESPINEKGLADLMKNYSNKITATTDLKEALEKTDMCFICVGTPSNPKDGGMDLKYLRKVCKDISLYLHDNDHNYTVVIRSTIFPGTFDKMKEMMERNSEKKEGKDFHLVTNPEFLREGSAVKDFFHPPYVIIGTKSFTSGMQVQNCYNGMKTNFHIVSPGIAEMMKYATNSWHALKIVFGNEIGSVCKKLKIDSQQLMKIFCEDKILNLSSYYMMPGFAYGGSCLSKDTKALIKESENLKVDTPLLHAIPKSNKSHIKRAILQIKNTRKRKIGFLGVSFKAGTDDTRDNPIFEVIDKLAIEGYDVLIYDKFIPGADINKVLNQDVIVISTRDKELEKLVKKSNKIIINLQKC